MDAHNNKNRVAYYALMSELEALENTHRDADGHASYFADGAVDHENTMDSQDENGTPIVDGSPAYWEMMTRQAISAAAYRMEDVGMDLNKALGRVVF